LAGIDTRTLHRCADLAEEMEKRQVPLSLLFAPRRDGAVADWVRTRRAEGDAVLMHGFDHSPEPRARTIVPGRRAEFAGLPAHEAGLRLTAAISAMDRVGLSTDSFAPPRWFASRGTVTALARKEFTLCADMYGVRDLRTGGVHRARVLGFVQTERAETLWCFTYVLAAQRAARRGGLVRLAVDAADLARPGLRQAVLDAIDIARYYGAVGVTYPDVLKAPAETRIVAAGASTAPVPVRVSPKRTSSTS
jgi:predicted deacetylase